MALDVLRIFEQPPPPPGSHTLQIESKSPLGIFRALITVLKAGLAVLHGKNGVVDLTDIQREDIALLQQYFRAFNVELICEPYQQCREWKTPTDLADHFVLVHLPHHIMKVSFAYARPEVPQPRLLS